MWQQQCLEWWCPALPCLCVRRDCVVSGARLANNCCKWYLVSLRRMVLAVPILGGAHPRTGWGWINYHWHSSHLILFPLPFFFFFLFLFSLLQSKSRTHALQHHRSAPRVFSCHREIIATTTALPFACPHTFAPTENPLLPGQELLCQLRICFGHLVSDSGADPGPQYHSPLTIQPTPAIHRPLYPNAPLPPDSPPGCRVSACVHDECVCAIRAHRHIDWC